MPRAASVAAVVIVACTFLSIGCGPIVSTNSHVRRSGPHVGSSTFAEIRPGKTTAGWLLATLGEPTTRADVDGGAAEVWKWSSTEDKSGSGSVWLLYDGTSHKHVVTNTYVQLEDGVVTKKWRD